MRTAKAAAVVLLFVLIPLQAPYAEPVQSVEQTAAAQRIESASPKGEQPSAPEVAAPNSAPSSEVVARAESGGDTAEAPKRRARRTVDTDGYSLSARSLR